MVSQLAEEIYGKSIQLKKYTSKMLLLKKNRLALESEIAELQSTAHKLILELRDNRIYSNDYFELALFMSKTLAECFVYSTLKGKSNRETVKKYIWGFHNLPRAFFSLENPMKISPDQAMEYYKPYLKLD